MNALHVDLANYYAREEKAESRYLEMEALIEEQIDRLTSNPISFNEVVKCAMDNNPSVFHSFYMAFYKYYEHSDSQRESAITLLCRAINASLQSLASNSAAVEIEKMSVE